MTKKLLGFLALLTFSNVVFAQTTETFESYTTGKPTTFTTSGQAFTLTTANCSPTGGGMFSIFIPNQSYVPCSGSNTTNGGGSYGVGVSCTAGNCTGTSNNFIDNGTSSGTNQQYSIKTSNAALFTIKNLQVYVSTDNGSNPVAAGVIFIGKKGGVGQFTVTVASGLNTSFSLNNGFTYIDFTTQGGSNNSTTNIDELQITGTNGENYIAIDNFTFGPATPLGATISGTNLTCNGICTGSATVTPSGGVSPYTYSWAPSGGSGSTASSLCAITYTCTITDGALSSITKTVSITQPPAITSNTTSITNVACNGGNTGAASISASGGTGTLLYNWTPGNPTGDGTTSVTSLTAGTWTCTITDANTCVKTQTVSVSQPTVLGLTTASQTNVSVFGGNNGAASVNSATGGASGYTYDWTPGNPTGDGTTSVSGLTAGVWTCTVTDANSCSTSQTFTITQPAAGPAAALNFDGVDDVIKIAPSSGINNQFSANQITVEGWFYPTAYSSGGNPVPAMVTESYQGDGNVLFALHQDGPSQNVVTGFFDGAWHNISAHYNLNQWQHYAATYDQQNLMLYINGVLVASMAISNPLPVGTEEWHIGQRWDNPDFYQGSMDEVRIWNRALCQGEIQNNMNGELKLPQSGLVAYYRFNEGLASANNSGVISSIDSSGNTLNGLLYNFALNGNTSNWIAPGGVTTGSFVTPFVSPTVTVSGTTTICSGATTTLTANGNVSSYSWVGGPGTATYAVSPTSNTSYSVTGTNSLGCISNMAVTTVTVNQLPTIAASGSTLCAGDSYTISPSGANTYTYAPAGPVVTPGTTTNYTITGEDVNLCVNTMTVDITVNPLPNIVASGSTLCAGDSYTFSPSGGITYTYIPSGPVVTPGTTTNYTITGTDANNCSNTFTVDVTVNPLPSIFAMANTPTICAGAGDTLTGTGGVSYVWSSNAGSATTTSVSVNPTTTDTYTVTGTDANGCVNSNVVTITVNTCGSGINNFAANNVAIYPNPFSSSITVETESATQIAVVNVVGQIVYSAALNSGKHAIDLSNLTKGVYYLQLKTGANTTNRKLIKE